MADVAGRSLSSSALASVAIALLVGLVIVGARVRLQQRLGRLNIRSEAWSLVGVLLGAGLGALAVLGPSPVSGSILSTFFVLAGVILVRLPEQRPVRFVSSHFLGYLLLALGALGYLPLLATII